jgi:hypothetical protein
MSPQHFSFLLPFFSADDDELKQSARYCAYPVDLKVIKES